MSLRLLVSCCLLLTLTACEKKPRRDPVIAEVKTPLHAVVRAHETDVPAKCDETGVKRLGCLFKSEHRGCLYLEVGHAAEEPLPAALVRPGTPGEELDVCERSDLWTPSRLLLRATPQDKAELKEDEAGERIAVRIGAARWEVLYLLDGELLSAPSARTVLEELNLEHLATKKPRLSRAPAVDFDDEDVPDGGVPTFDWADYKTLDDNAQVLLPRVTGTQRLRLYERMAKRRGDAWLVPVLAIASMDDSWEEGRALLSQSGKQALSKALRQRLVDEGAGDSELVRYFIDHPAERPPNFADVLVEELAGAGSYYGESGALEALLELSDARAGTIACEQIGAQSVESLVNGYGYEDYGGMEDGVLYAAIARTKTKCTWVSLQLEKQACDVELRCTAKGDVEGYETGIAGDTETGLVPLLRLTQNPLCTAQQVNTLLAPWKPGDTTLTDPPTRDTFLLAAAYAQGPLPRDVVSRNGRRLYRVEHSPALPKQRKGQSDDDYVSELDSRACASMPTDAPTVVCRLPLSVTEVSYNGCRLRIDDAKQTLTLVEEAPPPLEEEDSLRDP